RMRALRKDLRIQAVELREQQACVTNGIYPDIPATSMGGVARHFYLHPDEAAMRRHDCQLRWLRNDSRVGANALRNERARAQAFVFLVSNGGDDDLSSQVALRCTPRGRAHGGNAAFHV